MSGVQRQGDPTDATALREAQRDAELVDRLKAGDARALDELFRRHREAAYGIAFRLVGNREDALDVVQESFIHVMRGVQAFRGQSSFRTWLYRIVTHAALDYRRWRSLRAAESLDSEGAAEPRPGAGRAKSAGRGDRAGPAGGHREGPRERLGEEPGRPRALCD